MAEKIFWLADSKQNKEYDTTTYYRCPGIEKFVIAVEKKSKIVGFIIDGNNIGFILGPK